jgi:hypothetical protein
VFGWSGGKQLVGQSYDDAKVKLAEQKAQRAEKKQEKRADREASGRGRFHRANGREDATGAAADTEDRTDG